MKHRANWLWVPVVALGLGACKKEEAAKAPETPGVLAGKPSNEVPVPPKEELKSVAVTVADRAAKLGFAKYLPQDTEMVVSFYNGSKAAQQVKSSKIWKLVQKEIGEGAGMEPDEDPTVDAEDAAEGADPANAPDLSGGDALPTSTGPALLLGSEVTIALGRSTGEQLGHVLTLNRAITYHQIRNLTKIFLSSLKSNDVSSLAEATEEIQAKAWIEALKDPAIGSAIFEKFTLPPLYASFKVAEKDRKGAAQQVASMLEFVNAMGADSGVFEPVKLDAAGTSFEGLKLQGAKVSAKLAQQREPLDKALGTEAADKIIAALTKKDLILVSGTLGEYVVVYLGSPDAFKLEETPEKSLLGSDALAFADTYLSKELTALIYGQKELTQQIMNSAGGMADITHGLRDGIAEAGGLGDTRDLETLLQLVGEREAALRKLAGLDSSGVIAFWEEGLKIEGYGGEDYGMMDWKTPNRLASLGDSKDVLLFANMTSEASYDEKVHAYFESLVETAYALTVKISEMPAKGHTLTQFKASVGLFDAKFRPDLLALWDAFGNDFSGSLGNEKALVVDLKGTAPAIPGMPQALVDQAKIPRLSYLRPVTDRAKLSGSWDKMNASLTSVLGKVSEMTGQDIPMQKPLSSERNGNVTWFFPLPLFTDDFLPSITVGEKWFVASSSKTQALDLIHQADSAQETRQGLWFSLNFRTLETYADDMLKIYSKNAEAIRGEPLDPDDQKEIQEMIDTLSDLDKLTIHSRREGSVLRSSIHLKTR